MTALEFFVFSAAVAVVIVGIFTWWYHSDRGW